MAASAIFHHFFEPTLHIAVRVPFMIILNGRDVNLVNLLYNTRTIQIYNNYTTLSDQTKRVKQEYSKQIVSEYQSNIRLLLWTNFCVVLKLLIHILQIAKPIIDGNSLVVIHLSSYVSYCL
jgi:hypothetical protein